MRVLAVTFFLQFGGIIHDLSDLLELVVAVDMPAHEQCPPDGPCPDCPPGCPNCHCAAVGSIVPAAPPEVSQARIVASLPARLTAAQVLTGPDRPALFRPPRA